MDVDDGQVIGSKAMQTLEQLEQEVGALKSNNEVESLLNDVIRHRIDDTDDVLQLVARFLVAQAKKQQVGLQWFVRCLISEHILQTVHFEGEDPKLWMKILHLALTIPGQDAFLFGQHVANVAFDHEQVLSVCCTDVDSMLRTIDFMNQLYFTTWVQDSPVTHIQADLHVRFPALVNGLIGMCASDIGGGGKRNDLCDAIFRFCLRKEMTKEWGNHSVLFQQMLLMLSQDMHMYSRTSVNGKRTIGVFSSWLIVWMGLKRAMCCTEEDVKTQLDVWASAVGAFAQTLFAEACWEVLDELAIRLMWWADSLNNEGLSENGWYNLSIPLSSSLRRPSYVGSLVSQIIDGLGLVATHMHANAVERLLFAPGASLKLLVTRDMARRDVMDSLQALYIKCSDEEALLNELLFILTGRAINTSGLITLKTSATSKVAHQWTLFLLDVAVARGLPLIPTGVSIVDIMKRLEMDSQVQMAYLNLVFSEQASLVEDIITYGLDNGNRAVIEYCLTSCHGIEIPVRVFRALIQNNLEDWKLRLLATKSCTDIPTLFYCLSDTNDQVRMTALDRLGSIHGNFTSNMLSSYRRDVCKFDSYLAENMDNLFSTMMNFRVLDTFFASLSGDSLVDDQVVLSWAEESTLVNNRWKLDQLCTMWLANFLIGSKLRSGFGPASATLPKLGALMESLSVGVTDEKPNQVVKPERVFHAAFLFAFHLEQALFKAGELGSKVDPNQSKLAKIHRFFFTNRNVCLEWLSRSRPSWIQACLGCGITRPFVLWHGYQAFLERRMARQSILKYMGRVLVKQKEHEAVHDLGQWLENEEMKDVLNAVSLHAKGRFEEASSLYTEILDSRLSMKDVSSSTIEVISWCSNGGMQCLAALNDWEGLTKWTNKLVASQENAWANGNEKLADSLAMWEPSELVLAQSYAHFDQGNLPQALEHAQKLVSSKDLLSVGQKTDLMFLFHLMKKPFPIPLSGLKAQVANQIRVDLETMDASETCSEMADIQSRLWILKEMEGNGDANTLLALLDRNISFQSSSQLLRLLSSRPDFAQARDTLYLNQLRTALQLNNLVFAKRCLELITDDPTNLQLFEQQVYFDIASGSNQFSPSTVETTLKMMFTGKSSHNKVAQRLRLFLAACDPQKRGHHLQEACKLIDQDEPMNNCWLQYGEWARANGQSQVAANCFTSHLKHKGTSPLACMWLLELLNEGAVETLDDQILPSKPWLGFIPQLLGAKNDASRALALSIAEKESEQFVWSFVAMRQTLPETFSKQLLKVFPRDCYDVAETVVSELVGSAVWVEERWYALIGRLLSKKSEIMEVIHALRGNETLDEQARLDRCAQVMAPTILALKDLYEATFGPYESASHEEAEEEEDEEDEEEEDDDDNDDGDNCDEDEEDDDEEETDDISKKVSSPVLIEDKVQPESDDEEGGDSLSKVETATTATMEEGVTTQANRKSNNRLKRHGETKRGKLPVVDRTGKLQQDIKDAIEALSNFRDIGQEKAWRALELEQRKLQLWMKNRQGKNRLKEFAPNLFDGFKTNALRMPIAGTNAFIHSFLNKVVVLNTKTRPKRLWIRGSDGRDYAFLLKGGEDLRVDERVMQMGRIINASLQQQRRDTIRTYEVIPLGQRVGLIQWVGNATPILSVYKDWHEGKGGTIPLGGSDYRGLVMNKIKAKLQLDDDALHALPRSEWPMDVLVEVLNEVSSMIPSNLIGRVLWSSSPDPMTWWKRSCQFARSVAATSMFGYAIGLGDRHLDNMLINMSNGPLGGQVVHIDYAVCFDKGRRLLVPETVPFRLTKIIRGALPFDNNDVVGGACNGGGVFGSWAETVLGKLKENKDVLESLIGSLVHDKSIDWMSESEKSDYSLDVNVSISLIASEVLNHGSSSFETDESLYATADQLDMMVQNHDDKEVRKQIKLLRRRAHMDQSHVWANISNIRRGANKEGPYYELASKLMQLRNEFFKTSLRDVKALHVITGEMRQLFLKFVEHGNDVDEGRLEDADEAKKKRRDAMAADVLKRLKAKLDVETNNAKQVADLVKQATDTQRLAKMYEGWQPYV